MKILRWAAWGAIVLVGIVLSLKSLREPDVWWMLKTGQMILETGSIMKSDIFSFTFEGVEWVNVKWGYEVLLAFIASIGGPEFLMILQVFATFLILWFAWKNYENFRQILGRKVNEVPGLPIIISSMLLLFAIEYRFLGRPEMTTHVMTGIFLLFIVGYRFRPSKLIYAVIPLQILWANMHEAFGTGVVMLLGATLAMWVERSLAQRDMITDVHRPKELTLATVLAVLGTAIHPSGTKMITHPFEIFTQINVNKYTTENAGFLDSNFWEYQAYIAFAVFAIGLVIMFLNHRQEAAKWYLRPIVNFGLGYTGLFVAFFYLALGPRIWAVEAHPALAREHRGPLGTGAVPPQRDRRR
jgi:hypothetical protein